MAPISGPDLFTKIEKFSHAEADATDGLILGTSWAVWKKPEGAIYTKESDVKYPGDDVARTHAHARAILLALNPGNDRDRGDWSNFHHSWASRDQLLAEACRGTGLWGSLMTDLYNDQFQSNSSKVLSEKEQSGRAVERLLNMVALTGEEAPLVICLGGKTFRGVKEGLDTLGASPTALRYIQTTHYSGAAAGKHKHDPGTYRELVHADIRQAGRGDLLEAPAP